MFLLAVANFVLQHWCVTKTLGFDHIPSDIRKCLYLAVPLHSHHQPSLLDTDNGLQWFSAAGHCLKQWGFGHIHKTLVFYLALHMYGHGLSVYLLRL